MNEGLSLAWGCRSWTLTTLGSNVYILILSLAWSFWPLVTSLDIRAFTSICNIRSYTETPARQESCNIFSWLFEDVIMVLKLKSFSFTTLFGMLWLETRCYIVVNFYKSFLLLAFLLWRRPAWLSCPAQVNNFRAQVSNSETGFH